MRLNSATLGDVGGLYPNDANSEPITTRCGRFHFFVLLPACVSCRDFARLLVARRHPSIPARFGAAA